MGGYGEGLGGSLKGPELGQRTKVAALGAVSARNLHPRRPRPNQPFPSPLYTLLGLPGLQHRFENPGEGEDRGQNPTTSNGGFSSPHEDGAEGRGVAPARRQAQGLGVGHSPRRGPGGGSQPRTVGRGGEGEEEGDPRGRGAAGRPAPGTPAARSPEPPRPLPLPLPLPPPLKRGAPPLLAQFGGGGGAEVRIGGAGTGITHALGWPLAAPASAEVRDWLRGPKRSLWALRAGKM